MLSRNGFNILSSLALSTTLLLLPDTTAAQGNTYRGQILKQLNTIEEFLAARGYVKTHEYYIDTISKNSGDAYTVNLQGADCSDIDIAVYDENGRNIAEDSRADDLPFAKVTPRWTGKFSIQVTVPGCRELSCAVGVAAFGEK